MDKEVDKAKLRNERKLFIQYFIVAWFLIAVGVAISKNLPIIETGNWTILHLVWLIVVGFAVYMAIKFFKQMYQLDSLLYENPKSYNILYTILMVGGFMVGFLFLIPLLILWFKARKILITRVG